MIWLSTTPERYRMKRITEWISLVTGVIRPCMGWIAGAWSLQCFSTERWAPLHFGYQPNRSPTA